MSTSATTPEKRDLRLLVAGTVRALGVGDSPLVENLADPPIEDIVRSLPSADTVSGVLLSGGEPTLRKDLPALLTALHEAGAPRLGIATDGLVLSSEKAVQFLKKSGLKRVRIGFHSGRPDAHDWIVGIGGAAKRVHKAIRTCVDAGLEVEVETLVTRPTAPLLEETVELLARLRVNQIFLRRLEGRNNATDHFIAASPRLGPSQAYIEGAIRMGEAWGVSTLLQGFPHCAAEIEETNFQGSEAEWWFAPPESELESIVGQFKPAERIRGCRDCDSVQACAGAPEDYVHCFGRLELNAKSSMPTGKSEVSVEEEEWASNRLSNTPPAPPARSGRTPATRPLFIQRQHKRDLHGDPMFGVPEFPLPDAVSEAFLEGELQRDIRIRLVQKSQEGVETLRIVPPSLDYPKLGMLLRDVTRLSFDKVEICGKGSGLQTVADVDLRRLRRRISRFDVAVFGPDAEAHDTLAQSDGDFETSLETVKRLKTFARVQAGAYGIVSDDADLRGYHEAWETGVLPGAPSFRLSADGGNLDTLTESANQLQDGPTKAEILRHIPPCLIERGKEILPQRSWYDVHGSLLEQAEHHPLDRIGLFDSCILAEQCSACDRCPGIASGWNSKNIQPIAAEAGEE